MKALENYEAEIIVIDNNSSDGSEDYITTKFNQIHWIQNAENVGFSKANNQGIQVAKGKYILLLNPDTLVNEDTLDLCLNEMNKMKNVGAMSVKMLDGSGQFLPESKRGLPTPFVAMCRFIGLSKVFPKSKIFNKYYLGYLSENDIHEVDALCGAFMLIPSSVLRKVGLLDDTFFMYGEDIDLSFRIQKAGYKVVYNGRASIIHYKGESTKKESLDYVKKFNQAMVIFAEKHFSFHKAWWYKLIINLSIYTRAAISVITGFSKRIWKPLIDFLLIGSMLWVQKEIWENWYYQNDSYYPESYVYLNIPLYALTWTVAMHLPKAGSSFWTKFQSIGVATLILFSIYGLLPLELRPSRFLIVLGAISIMVYQQMTYWMVNKLFRRRTRQNPKILIAGSQSNASHILQKLEFAHIEFDYQGNISRDAEKHFEWQGFPEDLPYRVSELKVDEVIFSSEEFSFQEITHWMERLGREIRYRIAGDQESGIIGSLSKNTAGEFYSFETNYRIEHKTNRLAKRVLDISFSALLLIFSPILVWFIQDKKGFLRNCLGVIKGRSSWVSYHQGDQKMHLLPLLKNGILNPCMQYRNTKTNAKLIHKINQLYAKEYTPIQDVVLIFKRFRFLGNTHMIQ